MKRHGWVLALILMAACGTARAQWEIQNSGTTADLRGIDNVGGGVAWASGTQGTVLRTEDGGYLWQACAIPPGAEHLDFRGVQAFDANTAIAMSSGKGDLSRLYKTTDGCHTWKLVFTNPDKDGFWDAIRITGGRAALMIGDPLPHKELDRFKVKTFFHFPLYGTIDGGDIWNRLDSDNLFALSDKGGKPTQFMFAASNSSLMEIAQHRLIIFATGGAIVSLGQLEIIDHPNPMICKSRCTMAGSSKVPLTSGPTAGAFSVAVKDSDSPNPMLIVVGGDYSEPDNPDAPPPPVRVTQQCSSRLTSIASPRPPRPMVFAPPSPTTAMRKLGSPSGPTAPTSPPTMGRTGARFIRTLRCTKHPTPTATGTRCRCRLLWGLTDGLAS